MDRHARSKRRKGIHHMTNAEANTAATVAERGAHVAPERASSKKGATRRKGAPRGPNTAKGGKGKAAAPRKEAKTPREGSKKAKVLALLGRKEGATLAQLMKATGWQAHSVRGFLSGALGKKMGLTIESTKTESGDRIYKLGK
jgi:Protein of unknown function (DUF3489)